MVKKVLIHFIVFISVIAVLWGLLIISSCIPNSAIKENMTESALFYSDKDPFVFNEKGAYNSVSDNYADSILLNIVWNIKSNSPVVSSLDTKYYDGDEYGENWGLYQTINGMAPNTDYTRYWHGSVAFIRPLMIFTDVNGVKNISFTALVILIAVTLVLLIAQKHYFAAAALAASLVGIQFWNIRLSLEYIPAFMVCFFLCPLYIALEKKGDIFLTALSVAGGVMIAFFDFLTVETITLLVPLVLVFIIRTDDNRLGTFKENLLLTVKCGVCWGISYIMTFVTKWTAATVVTGENKFSTAFSAAGVRMYGEEEMPVGKQIFAAIGANLSTLFGGTERIEPLKIIIGLLAAALICGGIFFMLEKKKKNIPLTLILLIISVIPYLRYMVLNNHSYLHEFFTYRAQITVIMCLCSMVWYNIELRKRR
ncbi:MAG: hypothetical protein IJ035_07140 [Oscillospiraceae bacterium]|nr:hypothetical protein [Oscillospiraceae bacterium]